MERKGRWRNSTGTRPRSPRISSAVCRPGTTQSLVLVRNEAVLLRLGLELLRMELLRLKLLRVELHGLLFVLRCLRMVQRRLRLILPIQQLEGSLVEDLRLAERVLEARSRDIRVQMLLRLQIFRFLVVLLVDFLALLLLVVLLQVGLLVGDVSLLVRALRARLLWVRLLCVVRLLRLYDGQLGDRFLLNCLLFLFQGLFLFRLEVRLPLVFGWSVQELSFGRGVGVRAAVERRVRGGVAVGRSGAGAEVRRRTVGGGVEAGGLAAGRGAGGCGGGCGRGGERLVAALQQETGAQSRRGGWDLG